MQTNKIRLGQSYEFEITVTEDMRAHFGSITVHNLYATAAMLTHMEWGSRQHILPALEEGEEGVGYHMSIDHMAPVPIGKTVRIQSVVTDVQPSRITCHCEAYHGARKIGQGTIVQAILRLTELHARIS